MSVPKIMGVVVRILFLISVELKIYCMLYAFHKLYLLFPVLNHHICYLVGVRLFCLHYSVASSCLGKITKVLPWTPSGLKMADQNVGLGSFPSSPLALQGLKCLLIRVYNWHLWVLAVAFYLQPVTNYISHIT